MSDSVNVLEQLTCSNWFALHCKAHCEAIVEHLLAEQGVEVFYPRYRLFSQRAKDLRRERSLFPGYLFIRADPAQMGLKSFRYLPGVIGPVCFDGQPAPIPNSVIDYIRQRVESVSITGHPMLLDLRPGDRVRILKGPFKDLEAVFDDTLDGRGRVRVLLGVLGRLSRVELPVDQITKVRLAPEPATLCVKRHRRTRGRGRPCRLPAPA